MERDDDAPPVKNPETSDAADRPLRLTRYALLRRLLFRRLPSDEAKAVREAVERDGALTERYVLMCALSAGIATLGLLQSSTAVVIGAMLVSPLMSPIASLGFAFASLEGRRAEQAAKVLGVGIAVGVAVGMLLTWISPIRNPTPEILSRTAPTLLDLAIAVLSGLAGGYATVHRKGETAIGVAIATALMPPLATLGYSIATARFTFAGGALLLFLTNLGAISFSFALVARIRGVARPLARVDFKPTHIAAITGAFLLLATPLALTLQRVSREAFATQAARTIITDALGIESPNLAQLGVRWAGSRPEIAATAIVGHFDPAASDRVRQKLGKRLRSEVTLDLQQIVAADPRAEARAVIDAAIAQIPASLPVRAPPPALQPQQRQEEAAVAAALSATRLQTVAAWAEPQRRIVHMVAAPSSGSLADVRAEEARLGELGLGWTVEIIPPFVERITIFFDDGQTTLGLSQTADVEIAKWALDRWAATQVAVEGLSGANRSKAARRTALARATSVADVLGRAGEPAPTIRSAATTIADALSRQAGPERVRAADILAFPAQ